MATRIRQTAIWLALAIIVASVTAYSATDAQLYTHQPGTQGSAAKLGQNLPAGKSIVLADLEGPGVIRHIWMTHPNRDDEGILAGRGVIIRAYWDGEKEPSIEVPLHDFFGVGFGEDRRLDCAAWARDGNRSVNIWLPMPFKKHARVELVNRTETNLRSFYWWVDYEKDVPLPKDMEYLHAQYRQAHPVKKNGSYTLLDADGHGKYVGTLWNIHWLGQHAAPENAFNFAIDGQFIPGCNSEDYFGQAWGFRRDMQLHYIGQSLGQEPADIGTARMSSYRWHLPDPIKFQKSFKMLLDNHHYRDGYRTDIYETVAFWYQSEPHRPFPALPKPEDMYPLTYENSYPRKMYDIYQLEKQGKFEAALSTAEWLLQHYPENPKTPDVLYKEGNIYEHLEQLEEAKHCYRRVISDWPKSVAAKDARDKLWLFKKSGRALLTLITPSGWEAFLDGNEVSLSAEVLRSKPDWAEREHYRYGRVVSEVKWNDNSSSIMRLPTVRVEPGTGRHVLAVAAHTRTGTPIQQTKLGNLVCVIDVPGPDVVSNGSWKMTKDAPGNWQRPSFSAESWGKAVEHPNSRYQDAAWLWLYPKGFRKFPGYFERIWEKDIVAANETIYFRKTFEIQK